MGTFSFSVRLSRFARRVFYAAVIILTSAIVLWVASPGNPGDEPLSYVYDVRIEADRETIEIGESFTVTVYLYNLGDRDVLLEPISQFTLGGRSLYDPEPVSCIVNVDYPAGAKIMVGARDSAALHRQVFTPGYPGPFTVTCLGTTQNVTVTGYKEVALNSTGISLVIEPSRTGFRDGARVEFSLAIKNGNPYPVKVPVFNKLSYSLTPDSPIGAMYIDWVWRYFEVEAESQGTVWNDSFLVRHPRFSLYYYVDGVTASLELEVER